MSVTTSLPDCPWTATSNKTWIQILGQSATAGSGTLDYGIQTLSHSSSDRSGRILLTVPLGSTGTPYVTVTQSHAY